MSPPTSSQISPVSDGCAGPACGCVSVRPRCKADGRTDVVAVVLHSVCVLKAAVRPLVPCPACPAARARSGQDGAAGTGPEHLTSGTPVALAGPTPCVGLDCRHRGALPPRACFSFVLFPPFLLMFGFFGVCLPPLILAPALLP